MPMLTCAKCRRGCTARGGWRGSTAARWPGSTAASPAPSARSGRRRSAIPASSSLLLLRLAGAAIGTHPRVCPHPAGREHRLCHRLGRLSAGGAAVLPLARAGGARARIHHRLQLVAGVADGGAAADRGARRARCGAGLCRGLCRFVAYLAILLYEWFIARIALEAGALPATALVLLDVVLGAACRR